MLKLIKKEISQCADCPYHGFDTDINGCKIILKCGNPDFSNRHNREISWWWDDGEVISRDEIKKRDIPIPNYCPLPDIETNT